MKRASWLPTLPWDISDPGSFNLREASEYSFLESAVFSMRAERSAYAGTLDPRCSHAQMTANHDIETLMALWL